MNRRLKTLVTMVLAVLALTVGVACSSDNADSTAPNTEVTTAPPTDPNTDDGSAASPQFDGHGADVDESMFGEAWPLTISSGRVNCVKVTSGLQVVFTSDDNKRYALNGTAKAMAADFGYLPLEQIWADDPSTGAKKDISVLSNICDPLR